MSIRKTILLVKVLILILSTKNLIGQENKNRADAYSGATSYNQDANYKGNISGKVRDNLNKKNLEFTTVTLKKNNSNKIIEGTITDNKGRFSFKNVSVGKYKLIFSYIGFKDKEVRIETSKKNPDLKLNKILLTKFINK